MNAESTAEDIVVACSGLTRHYRRNSSDGLFGRSAGTTVTALVDIDCAISTGEFVGLSGPSGSGKSTLLHLLAGLDTPTEGTVRLAGHDLGTLGERARTRVRRQNVGLVFQRFYLLPALSARANVALPLLEAGVPKRQRRERAESLLSRVGLSDRHDHRPGELSGGEQQRVAIARAVANDPALLLADEPTGELDTETGSRIVDLFEELASDRAVVVASHDTAVIERTDRTIRLRDGRIDTDTTSWDD